MKETNIWDIENYKQNTQINTQSTDVYNHFSEKNVKDIHPDIHVKNV